MKYLILSTILLFSIPTLSQANEILILGASWCNPCKQLREFIKNSKNIPDSYTKIEYLDIEKHPETKEALNVTSVPTSFIYNDGKLVARKTGFTTKTYLKWIKNNQ